MARLSGLTPWTKDAYIRQSDHLVATNVSLQIGCHKSDATTKRQLTSLTAPDAYIVSPAAPPVRRYADPTHSLQHCKHMATSLLRSGCYTYTAPYGCCNGVWLDAAGLAVVLLANHYTTYMNVQLWPFRRCAAKWQLLTRILSASTSCSVGCTAHLLILGFGCCYKACLVTLDEAELVLQLLQLLLKLPNDDSVLR
jgi:hypothetical protein